MHSFDMLRNLSGGRFDIYKDYRRRVRISKLSRKDLVAKAVMAANEIGIQNVIALEWDHRLMQNFPTCGGIREKKYGDKAGKNEELDIGYFKLYNEGYSARSLLVNPYIMSEEKANAFLSKLRKQGLNPEIFSPIEDDWLIEEAHLRIWRNRRVLYQ